MKIHIYNHQKDLPIEKGVVRKVVHALSTFLSFSCKEIAVYFVTKKRIAALHEQFFDDPTETDCITFPLDETFLGEIFICPAVAITYAKKRGLDSRKELLLYLIHSILHLLGLKDCDPKSRRDMRKKEKSCMHYLKEEGLFL